MIGEKELCSMKKGSSILNLSRGSILDLNAVRKALDSGHLSGAALDVYTQEPKGNKGEFRCDLTGMDQVVLTPHIGGSTEEAQEKIGLEVATSFIKFIDAGTTTGAVNFPQVELPEFPDSHRILNVHKNEPGVMNDVNRIIADLGANINAQYVSTYQDIGYLIVDLDKNVSDAVKSRIEALPSNIRTRILY
jgi:D-3-phosphoglycerate dehydrogenase